MNFAEFNAMVNINGDINPISIDLGKVTAFRKCSQDGRVLVDVSGERYEIMISYEDFKQKFYRAVGL